MLSIFISTRKTHDRQWIRWRVCLLKTVHELKRKEEKNHEKSSCEKLCGHAWESGLEKTEVGYVRERKFFPENTTMYYIINSCYSMSLSSLSGCVCCTCFSPLVFSMAPYCVAKECLILALCLSWFPHLSGTMQEGKAESWQCHFEQYGHQSAKSASAHVVHLYNTMHQLLCMLANSWTKVVVTMVC